MSFLSSWRSALRIAQREARRARGRSLLVVAMIGLPVLCLSFTAISYDMLTLTGAEKADRTMGAADARVEWPSHWPVLQHPDPAGGGVFAVPLGPDENEQERQRLSRPGSQAELMQALPPGSYVLPVGRGGTRLRTTDGTGLLRPDAVMVDATNPLTRGYVEVLAGRAPVKATEVALTEQAMARLGARIGDSIATAGTGDTVAAGTERRFTVVGQVEFPSLLDTIVLFAPDPDERELAEYFSGQLSWLVRTPEPITWADVQRYNAMGMVVSSRAVLIDPPPDDEVPALTYWDPDSVNPRALALVVLVVGLALLEVVLLAGPAFAVSARRRRRQLALVAANGGTPVHVRRIVLADGVVLGAAGAVAGIALAVPAAFLARPFIEELLAHTRAGGYRVFPAALAAIAGLAVVTGACAALVPAFVAGRQSVVASLTGRRGITRSRRRWIAVGIAMIAVGGAITVVGTAAIDAGVMLAGLVVGELGLVLCTPALVGLLARLSTLLPLAPRIALRDAGRNRAAAAPAISAVMAAVAGAVALGMIVDSNRERDRTHYQQTMPAGTVVVQLAQDPDHAAQPAEVERQVRRTLPVAELFPTGTVTCPAGLPDDGYCVLTVEPAQECAALDSIRRGEFLTAQQRREAAADPRCDPRYQWAGTIVVDDGSALGVLTGASGEELARAREVLRAGGAVVASPLFLNDGVVTLTVQRYEPVAAPDEPASLHPAKPAPPRSSTTRVSVPGTVVARDFAPGLVVLSPAAVAAAGLATRDAVNLVASTTRAVTQDEQDRAMAALQSLNAYPSFEQGFVHQLDTRLLLLLVAAVVITLGAAAVGTGLAAADGRADLSTLAAVGASPRLRRVLSVSQSGVIAGVGCVLGASAGAGTAIAVVTALNIADPGLWPEAGPLPLVAPWLPLLPTLVATPLTAMLGAGLLTRSRLPIERRI